MEEDTETEVPVFFRGICRACIKKKKELFPLFGGAKIKFGEKCFTISEILFLGGRVKTNYDDKLPKHVCRKCLTRLIEIFSFQLKCIETDLKLKGILSSYTKSPVKEINLDQSIDKDGDVSIESGGNVKKEKLDVPTGSINGHDIQFEKVVEETGLIPDTENINNNNSSSKGSISDIVVSILEDKDQQVSVSMTLTLNDKNQTRPSAPQPLEKHPTIQEVKSIATERKEFSSLRDNDKHNFINHSMNELNEKTNETEKNQGKFICTFCKNSFDTWSDLGKHIVKHKIQNNYGRLKSESPPATLNSDAITVGNEPVENISNAEDIHIQNNSIDDNIENTIENNESNKERSNEIRLSVLSEQEMPILTAYTHSSQEERFYCEFCPANYKYRADVKRHIRQKHIDKYPNEEKYECNICKELFIMHLDLVHHKKTHGEDRPHVRENIVEIDEESLDPVQYKCLLCSELFPKFLYVRRHLFGTHKIKCTEIAKNYRKIVNKAHLRKQHEKEKRGGIYTCLVCHKKFQKYVEIVRHRRQHHKKKSNKIRTVSRGNEMKLSIKNTLDNYFQRPNGKINNENEINYANDNNAETTEIIQQNNLKKDNLNISNKSIDSDDNSKDLTNPPRFCCIYCPMHYARIHDLKLHLKAKHKKNLSNVKNVPRITTAELLESSPEIWRCDICRIIYSSKKSLYAHRKQKHADIEMELKTSKPIQELNAKTGQNIFKCKLCDATFSHFFGWKTHTFTKHRNNNKKLAVTSHECPTCKKTFLRKTSLICHLKVHELSKNLTENNNRTKPSVSNTTTNDVETDRAPSNASTSNASTSSLNNSLNTIDINYANQIHKCLICPSIFDNRSNLRRHTRVRHTDKVREYTQEKSPKHMFQCLACYKWFLANPHLKVHMRRHLSLGVTEIPCSICPKTFGDQKSYAKHLSIHRAAATKSNRYCKECLIIFPNEKGYKIHMYKHK